MTEGKARISGKTLAAMALAVAALSPAAADVRAGVAAWERGDHEAAVREWEASARHGDRDAQFNLAQAYRLGRGVPVDLERAEGLYRQAAAKGHAKAADTLGLMLHQAGRLLESMPYLEAAVARGDARAQYLYAIALFQGELVARDRPRAHALLTLAERGGVAQARQALAQVDALLTPAERAVAVDLARTLAKAAAAATRDGHGGPRGAGAPIGSQAAGSASSGAPAAGVQKGSGRLLLGADHSAMPQTARQEGAWKLQLGVFAVPANADALWARLSTRPELAGRIRQPAFAGSLTKLVAAGFETFEDARQACDSLAAGGQPCLVIR